MNEGKCPNCQEPIDRDPEMLTVSYEEHDPVEKGTQTHTCEKCQKRLIRDVSSGEASEWRIRQPGEG